MSREKKAQVIEDLAKLFGESRVGVLTEYRGITANEITVLRRKLGESRIKFRVVKNTLAGLAAEKTGKSTLSPALKGPLAIAFGYGGEIETARAVFDYIRATKSSLTVAGGFLDNRLLTSDEVKTLATLPPRETLVALVIGGIQAPIQVLLGYLNAPVRELVGTLEARMKQLEAK